MTTADDLCALLGRQRFRTHTEAELHVALATCFTRAAIPFEREVELGPEARVDFFLPPGLAVEVKILGSTNNVLRQLGRYAEFARVQEVVLVTTRLRLASAVPDSLAGKPVIAIHLEGSVFA
jgi:hypothetical protein